MDYNKSSKSKKPTKKIKKNGIKYVTLDESILDIDSWLPEEAIQQVVKIIKQPEEKEIKGV